MIITIFSVLSATNIFLGIWLLDGVDTSYQDSRIRGVLLDVGDVRATHEVIQSLGDIDLLVNNAGKLDLLLNNAGKRMKTWE